MNIMKPVIVWAFIGIGLLLMIGGALWSWLKAAQDSPESGRKYFLGWGSFQLLYIIEHWETMKIPTFLWLVGALIFGLGTILGWKTGMFHR